MPKIPSFASKIAQIAEKTGASAIILVSLRDKDGSIALTSTGVFSEAELNAMLTLLQEVVADAFKRRSVVQS
jgi:predicted xylose isomerase-like sugar epimerase